MTNILATRRQKLTIADRRLPYRFDLLRICFRKEKGELLTGLMDFHQLVLAMSQCSAIWGRVAAGRRAGIYL